MSDYHSVTSPAREIPPPQTISPEAQLALSQGAAMPRNPWPDATDKAAWREYLKQMDGAWDEMAQAAIDASGTSVETHEIDGVTFYKAEPPVRRHEGAYLYFHGGAFVVGAGMYAKSAAARYAATYGVACVSVDYRMPPDHPWPQAPEDCYRVYRRLLESTPAERIVIGGTSAGGNLAAVTALIIRDRGLDPPSGVVLLTPETDLTESGDTFRTNADLDIILKGPLPQPNLLYANGHDLTDPYLSPIFADFSKGFPRTLVQSGTRDLFLSNSVLFHRALRRAGVTAELHVWEAMPHAGYSMGPVPEHDEIDAEVAHFIGKCLG